MSKHKKRDPNDAIEGQIVLRQRSGKAQHFQAQAAAKPAPQAVSGKL